MIEAFEKQLKTYALIKDITSESDGVSTSSFIASTQRALCLLALVLAARCILVAVGVPLAIQ